MYILGIDFGDGETSAAVLEVDDNAVNELRKTDSFSADVHLGGDGMPDLSGAMKKLIPAAIATMSNGASVGDNVVIKDYADEIEKLITTSVTSLENVKLKGTSDNIPSALCWDYEEDEWIIGPDLSAVKECFDNLDLNTQVPKMMAYFKGALVDGSGEANGGNNLKAITEYNKESWGEFIKAVYKNIIKYNSIFKADGSNFKLYVACPSQWEPRQKKAYYDFLRELGLPVEDVVEESRAANMSFSNTIPGKLIRQNGPANVLIIDYGSSTIDFTWYGKGTPINHGAELGARNVEKIIFEYMIEHEDQSALPTFKQLATLYGNGNEEDGKAIAAAEIIYGLKKNKEAFCDKIAEGAKHPRLEDLYSKSLSNRLSRQYDFGFNDGRGYNREKLEGEVLADYIAKVKDAFIKFRDRQDVHEIDCVMLTGGASIMPFVKDAVKEIFHVTEGDESHEQTLFQDSKPQYSISNGIACFGLYKYLSDPLRKEIDDLLNSTWLNVEWISRTLKEVVPGIVQKVYKERLEEIVVKWAESDSPIVFDHAKNNIYPVLGPIIAERATHSDNMSEFNLWDYINKSKEAYYADPTSRDGNHSAHALLIAIYEDLGLDHTESNEKIDELISQEITTKVNDSVELLFRKLLSIYFGNAKLNAKINLNYKFNIKVSIDEKLRTDFIANLTEAVCKGVEGNGGVVTVNTFDKGRNAVIGFNTRSTLVKPLKEALGESCNAFLPEFDKAAISKSIKEKVSETYKKIRYYCDLETYRIK